MTQKKNNRGGKRAGAGRPKSKEDTKVMRVPVSLVPKVQAMIAKHKPKKQPPLATDEEINNLLKGL